MPANKNAMTRYMILDELLSNRYHNYSLDDLTEEVSKRLSDMYPETSGVVRRTIEKDIYYLEYEGPFMVEIERYSISSYNAEIGKTIQKKCLRYADPSFSIFKKKMSADEEYLLRELFSLLGQFDGLPNLKTLERLRIELGVRDNEKQIISFTKNPLENSNLLGELFTAISQKQVVKLNYHRFVEPERNRSIIVYPYFLKEYNHRWFLFCEAEAGSKILSFALDRIDSVELLSSHKYKEYTEDINSLFEDIIGVTLNQDFPIYHIIFWVSDNSKDYVRTKPLHESQKCIRGEKEKEIRDIYPFNGGSYFSIDCRCNYELERELTSFGKDLIVLSPSELQNKIFERIQDMNKLYQKIRT